MRLRWYGQSAFRLEGREQSVVIDPFGDAGEQLAARGLRFAYPPIESPPADVVLVTHEHSDHNAVEVVAGEPHVIRSTPGTHESPVGTVTAVASEHDAVAGTARGPNAIMVLTLDGLAVCHLGDLGQPALRDEQAAAVGTPDVLMVPVGGGPTLDGPAAAEVVRRLRPRLVVPMHHRTPAVDFLEPPEPFLEALGSAAEIRRLDASDFEVEPALGTRERPVVVLPAAPA